MNEAILWDQTSVPSSESQSGREDFPEQSESQQAAPSGYRTQAADMESPTSEDLIITRSKVCIFQTVL